MSTFLTGLTVGALLALILRIFGVWVCLSFAVAGLWILACLLLRRES